MISSILFILLLATSIWLFSKNAKKIIRNIHLGVDVDRSDNPSERWKTMGLVALGQSKMVTRPVAGIMHILIYVGFILINIEVLEIILDGILGSHRLFSFMGDFYNFLIGFFEILAFLVTLACIVFLARRNIIKLKRFISKDLNGWPRSDATIILITEILLMSALFTMNACDQILQQRAVDHYTQAGSFPVSSFLVPAFQHLSTTVLIWTERICWWFHIVGIFAFLNYLPYSKHLHIVLSFPNVFFSNLKPKGQLTNLQSISNEVKAMLDPSFVPPTADPSKPPSRFGAKEVTDLSWKQLLDSYSCTECGRCTSVCPANQTGKLLSPRKIMMSTRDRLEEVGKNIDANGGNFAEDGKSLNSEHYITPEELWACTSCNACVQECPINIDPLSIIIDLRRYLVMEQSAAPQELNLMFTNVENNGAPWQFSPSDRLNWAKE